MRKDLELKIGQISIEKFKEFEVPSGVTKTRLYIWIEGQDIDSIATDSKGALLDVSINFSKDTAGQY